MRLRNSNLYADGKLVSVSSSEDILIRELVTVPSGPGDGYHRVSNTDEITVIAFKYYKDKTERAAEYWWLIADANDIANPMDLSDWVGRQLRIPDFNEAQTALSG